VGQLAKLQLGRAERRRASDAGATLAPRNALPGLGNPMRLPASAAASLVGREHQVHSARHDPLYMQSSLGRPLPYAPREAARHSSAFAAHTAQSDTAPLHKGGFMSGLKRGVKGLTHAFGCGGRRSDSFSGDRSSSARYGTDAAVRRDFISRMEAPPPGGGIPQYGFHDEGTDAQVTQHDSPPAEAPVPQPPRASRRRPRDHEAWDSGRRVAGSAMRAQETTLPRPDPVGHRVPYGEDLPLIDRARAGMAANPRIDPALGQNNLTALRRLSAWLQQVGKPAMQDRLFSKELTLDAWKFVRLGGNHHATAALKQLRNMESSSTGIWEMGSNEIRKDREVPPTDRARIEEALGANAALKGAALVFSEWLAREDFPALTDRIVDADGVTRAALHSMTELARAYIQSPGAQYVNLVIGALKQLQIFDITGATRIKKRSHHLDIPEVDQRLIKRYQEKGNEQLREAAHAMNKPLKKVTTVDSYASSVRAFSDWLRDQQLPTIAAQLHAGTLLDELKRFADPTSSTYRNIRVALNAMVTMFPPEAPGVTFGRIGHRLFVQALGTLARAPDISMENAAIKVGADVDDLLVFLDARAEDGLTEAGRALVETFDGQALRAARANIAMRQQERAKAKAAQDAGQVPEQALPPLQATPVGWSQISWSDDAPAPHQDFGSAGSIQSDTHYGGHGSDLNEPPEQAQQSPMGSFYDDLSSINSAHRQVGFGVDLNEPPEQAPPSPMGSYFNDLSSINSAHHQGGFEFDLNEPSEEAQRERTDSAYAGLSPFASVSGYDGPGAYARTPSEVTGPSRPAPEIVEVDDYPSPQDEGPSVAQRLANNGWLRSDDLWKYSEMFLKSFARELGPGGRERINEMLNIGDASVLEQLMTGDARQRAAARKRLTAPVLLLPVNRATQNHREDHWSLLVVNRAERQAYHYDSLVPPDLARAASSIEQFQPQFARALEVASALGISRISGMPTAMQRDGHSCGDHVLAGIEALARRIVTPQGEVSWDLSGIRPSREHIVDTLTRHEQDNAPAPAAQPASLAQPVDQPARAALPVGPLGNNLDIDLAQLNAEMGFASGDALNCLIDTALQFTSNVRRRDNGQTREPELDTAVNLWREHLFAAGVVPRHGQIDFYDGSRAGQDLALNLGVRIQIIQWENGRTFAHPVLGQQGPLVHILHTPGHFQPLWPSRH
jgi:hypothetical protein